MAGSCKPSYPVLAVTEDEVTTPSVDGLSANPLLTEMQNAYSGLRFHMDNSVWDIVHDEVMDWRDPSWRSMNLPGKKTSLTLCLSSWDAREPTGLANDDDPVRKRILAQLISVQLLASCFTPPQYINTLTLLSSWYNRKNIDGSWLNTRLVSSLRQHTQWKHSPAFGHQARNNSAASLWPERDDALSREALLAEQVSFNRRLRQRRERGRTESNDTKRRPQSEPLREEPKRRRLFPSRHQRCLRTSGSGSSHGYLQETIGSRPEEMSPRCRVKQKNALKVMRHLRLRNVSDGHRWSLEPFLRSENHPVFVQPVKGYVMKRWRVFHSRSRKLSSNSASSEGTGKGPDYSCAASNTSRDSIQLSRRTQIMTMIQGSGASVGHLAPDAKASLNAPAGRERTNVSAEAIEDTGDHVQTISNTEAVECPGEDLRLESIDHCHSAKLIPCQFLQSSESGQIRNRTSTSGTTVYNPPLIAEASPNSKNLESDGSASSGTSTGITNPKNLHKGELVNASE